MLTLKTTERFEKDYKKSLKSGRDMSRLKRVMTWIANHQPLPPELRDHKLIGNYEDQTSVNGDLTRKLNAPNFSLQQW